VRVSLHEYGVLGLDIKTEAMRGFTRGREHAGKLVRSEAILRSNHSRGGAASPTVFGFARRRCRTGKQSSPIATDDVKTAG
jgi:hypothetical protein